MQRPPIPAPLVRDVAQLLGKGIQIDDPALGLFKQQLKEGYAHLRDKLNYREKEICLAEKVQRDRVAGVTAFKDKDSLLELPSVYGQSYNATLLLSLLTFLTYGKILYKGPPGFGKTTTAEEWGQLIYRLPLDWIQAATIYGNDKLTEEMVIARFDIGWLTKGKEVVNERLFSLLPFRMIDELNRIPAHVLSLLYQLVDRALHVYGNEHIEIPPGALFATINERASDARHSGNFPIPCPFFDRFDISVVVPGLNPLNFHALLGKILLEGAKPEAERYAATTKKRIAREQIDGLYEMWEAKAHIEKAQSEIHRVQFPGYIDGLVDPGHGEVVARIEFFLAQIFYCEQLAQNAELFWANKAYSQKKPLKEQCGEGDCKNKGRLCSLSDNYQASMRAQQSIIKYAKALAWFMSPGIHGQEMKVSERAIETLLPYLFAHRFFIEDTVEDKVSELKKHQLISQIWSKSGAMFDTEDVHTTVKQYYEAVRDIEKAKRESGGTFSLRDHQEKVLSLVKAIDAKLAGNPVRIPMLINLQQLVGDHGEVSPP